MMCLVFVSGLGLWLKFPDFPDVVQLTCSKNSTTYIFRLSFPCWLVSVRKYVHNVVSFAD